VSGGLTSGFRLGNTRATSAVQEAKQYIVVNLQGLSPTNGCAGVALHERVATTERTLRVQRVQPVAEGLKACAVPVYEAGAGAVEPAQQVVERLAMLRQPMYGLVECP
jgi:hypothetical protein